MELNPIHCIDFYKSDHRRQYPEGTTLVYSNFTPRSDDRSLTKDGHVVVFGLQMFIQDFLIDSFNRNFFALPKNEVLTRYKRRMDASLGPNDIGVEHIRALHDLGYLPIAIKALPEGTVSPIKTPVLTMFNTHHEFFWLVNYLETAMSAALWKPMTVATVAHKYRSILKDFADLTGVDPEFVKLQAHDFSFRGMSCMEDAARSGIGHLLSFIGTDTVTAIDAAEHYYSANADHEVIGGSVSATEHSVMCIGGQGGEFDTFRRLIEDVYPSGIISIVSDTWDFWKVITEFLPQLKGSIMARDGKVVIRPDSGDPVKIICGDPDAAPGSFEYKGAVECLWETFGGTMTDKGYMVLDSHIGLIYGDSITLERAYDILNGLERKGFASSNVVLGVGSYSYQYNTRDTYGFAMKATYGEVNGEAREIFKDPATDSGDKKSARGLLHVCSHTLRLTDRVNPLEECGGALKLVFANGDFKEKYTLQEIRSRLNGDAMNCTFTTDAAA